RVLARRARAAVRPAGRSARVPRPRARGVDRAGARGDARAPARLPGAAQAPHHAHRRADRGRHGGAQAGGGVLRAVVSGQWGQGGRAHTAPPVPAPRARMSARLLADLLVIVHLLFIAFAIFGGALALRWPKAAWL